MSCRRWQFLRTATQNIDPAAQVTRLKCRGGTFPEGQIADVARLHENFRNPSSRDKISITVKCDTLKCLAIMRAMANGNFSRKCSDGGLNIASGFQGRASSRQEMSPVLTSANYREI
jgi:hypothetical protein